MSLRTAPVRSLDGLRALAVTGVICFHFQYGWARGGYLGVDLFFVLSGFLITTLMIEDHDVAGRVELAQFWRRRARRILPALYALLVAVCLVPVFVHLVGAKSPIGWSDPNQLRANALAAFAFVANWYNIAHLPHNLFEQLRSITPLAHLWSLAVEEQFYLLWPFVTILLVRRYVQREHVAAMWCCVIAAASAVAMSLQYSFGGPQGDVVAYLATYARLTDLALGAALGWFVVRRPMVPGRSKWLGPGGVAGLTVVLIAMVVARGPFGSETALLYQGGLLVFAAAATLLVAAVRDPSTWVAHLFEVAPIRAVGRVSYGLYLWSWPVTLLMVPNRIHLSGLALDSARVLVMSVITYGSYVLIEQPIRQRRWSLATRRAVAYIGPVLTVLVIVVGTSSLWSN